MKICEYCDEELDPYQIKYHTICGNIFRREKEAKRKKERGVKPLKISGYWKNIFAYWKESNKRPAEGLTTQIVCRVSGKFIAY